MLLDVDLPHRDFRGSEVLWVGLMPVLCQLSLLMFRLDEGNAVIVEMVRRVARAWGLIASYDVCFFWLYENVALTYTSLPSNCFQP